MNSIDIKAYEIFKSKLGEREAEILIDYVDHKTEKSINQKTTAFSTKEESELIKWMPTRLGVHFLDWADRSYTGYISTFL